MPGVPELIFRHVKGLVLVEASVVETLLQWRQLGSSPEAGGVLLGFRRSAHLHVAGCTTPQSKDRRSRFFFYRRDNGHQKEATRFWNATGGTGYYLGEWHTHPEDVPKPSPVDSGEWQRLSRSKLGPEVLFIIVGRKELHVQLGSAKLRAT